MRKFLLLFTVTICSLFSFSQNTAPGGIVSDTTSFLNALGGNAIASSINYTNRYQISLTADVALDAPIRITSGQFFLSVVNNNFSIVPNDTLTELFYIEDGATLILCNSDANDSFSLHLSGKRDDTSFCTQNTIENHGFLMMCNNVSLDNFNGTGSCIDNYNYLSIQNSVIQNNNSDNFGGAIYSRANSNTILDFATIQNNSATYGGAIYIQEGASFSIQKSIIQNNIATLLGNAIFLDSNVTLSCSDSLTLINNDIYLSEGALISIDNFTSFKLQFPISIQSPQICQNIVQLVDVEPFKIQSLRDSILILNTDSLVLLQTIDNQYLRLFNPTYISLQECSSYYWNAIDSTFTESTTYTHYFPADSTQNCDSIVTLHLEIMNSTDTIFASYCENEFPIYLQNDTIEIPGTYTYNYTSSLSCDSNIIVIIESIPSIIDTLPRIEICSSELPYEYMGITITDSGEYYIDTECNGYHLLPVIVHNFYKDTIDIAICSYEIPYLFEDSALTETGSYTFPLHTLFGCDSLVTINLTVFEDPQLQIYGVDGICFGDSTILSVDTFVNYLWSNNDTTQFIQVNAPNNYSVTVTDLNGCIFSTTKNFEVNDYPITKIIGDTIICSGDTGMLIASGGEYYLWNTEDTEDTIHLHDSQTIILNAYSHYGCMTSDTVQFIVNPTPEFFLPETDTLCFGENVQYSLIFDSAYTYLWTTGDSLYYHDVLATESTNLGVVVTHQLGCTASKNIELTVIPLPMAAISGDSTICEHTSLELVASGEGSYLWNNGDTTDTLIIENPGQYTITVSTPEGCFSTATHNVYQISAIIPIISGNTVLCDGQSTILSAEGAYSYLWSTGEETADIVVHDSGRYSVTVTYLNGCIASAEKLVTINPNPVVEISGISEICNGKSTTLTATEGYSYSWNTGENTASIIVSPINNSLYFVTATNQFGCSTIATDSVFVLSNPIVNITGNDEFCEFTTTSLTATGGVSYLWNNNATSSEITISAANTYSVTATAANGCTASISQTVTMLPAPIPTITGDNIICADEQTVFNTTGGIAYQWSNGESNAEIQLSSTGIYTVTTTYANGCSASGSRNLIVNPLPQITISGDTVICLGETSLVTAGGGRTYLWDNGSSNALLISNPTQTTYQTLEVTSAAGCKSSRLVTIIVNGLPTPQIIGESTFCLGDSITLYAGGGTEYEWNTGIVNNSITIKNTGNYVVTVTNNAGCTSSMSYPVTANPRPSVNIIGNTTFCQGESITLMATGGSSYLWSNGSTQQSTTISNSNTYTVTATNNYNCTSTTSVNISPLTLPTASIVGNASFCAGQSTTLTAQGGITYHWNDGTTTPSITVSQPGTYSVTVTNAFGCSSSISKTIQMNQLPSPTITGNESFCEGNSTNLLASGGATYIWNTGSTNAYLSVSETGTYSVTATDNNGCSAIANKTVLVNSIPIITINGDTNICIGNSTILMANVLGGGQFNWSTGESSSFITVSPTNTTNYTVIVTNSNGCSNIGRFMVNVRQYPTPSILGNTSFCEGDSTILTATGGTNYIWNNGQNTETITTQTPGNYIVTVTNAYGCSSTTSREVSINSLPLPVISGTTAICQGDNATLTVSGGTTYLWSTDDVSATIHPSTAGTYYVTVTNAAGCTATAQTNLIFNTLPDLSITGENAICAGTYTILAAHSTQTNNFIWSTGSIGASTSISTAGIYSVTATNINGCTASVNHEIVVNSAETPLINGNLSPCAGETITLTANNGDSFQWSNGTIGNSIVVSPTNTITYTVTATSAQGCTASNSVAITIDPIPATIIQGEITICEGESTTLTAIGGTNFVWNNQQTSNSITVNTPGTYTVTATNTYGCSATPSVTVSSYPYPNAQISGNDESCAGDNLQLTASGGSSYIWSNGNITPGISVAPTQNMTYLCTVSNEYGCEVVLPKNITVNQYPTPQIYGDNFFCQNGSIQLTAAGGDTFVWNDGSTTPQISVSTQGVYTVTVTENNCSASTYTYISQYSNPIPIISGDLQFCDGSFTNLTATGGTNYHWNSGQNTASIQVNAAGSYHVTVTDDNGCTATTSVQTTTLTMPNLSITGNNSLCLGDSIILVAFGGNNYIWSNGETSSSLTISPNTTTPYSVTATNENNCSATESITVTVNPTYYHTISDNICQGNAYTNNGFNLEQQNSAGVFTYYRNLTTIHGCDSTIALTLTVNPKPVLSNIINGTTNIIAAGTYTYALDSAMYADSFEWSISNPYWQLGGSNNSTNTLQITTGGISVLSVFGINSCGISPTTSLQIVSSISIEEINIMENINIYPNPISQFVNIENNSNKQVNNVQIFDGNGKLVAEKEMDENTIQLDLSSFANGVYIIKLWDSNKVLGTAKIVKQ